MTRTEPEKQMAHARVAPSVFDCRTIAHEQMNIGIGRLNFYFPIISITNTLSALLFFRFGVAAFTHPSGERGRSPCLALCFAMAGAVARKPKHTIKRYVKAFYPPAKRGSQRAKVCPTPNS